MSDNPYGPHLFDKFPGEWWDDAACRDEPADWFFPPRSGHESQVFTARAKAVCARCPVTAECLTFAMTEPAERHGTWGGLTPDERRKLRAKQLQEMTNSNKGAK